MGYRRKNKLGQGIFLICAVLALFIICGLGYKIGENIKVNNNFVENSESGNNEESIKSDYDIEKDYLERKSAAEEVLPKGQGFFRYYSSLIETLRAYDATNIDNAKIIYKLSDELLNNMYQSFKENWTTEAFDELKSSQLIWIDRKMDIEEELRNNDLLRYQTLIKMTLDKCEEWTEYYK